MLQTLSKAYGLAGARVGCAIADAEMIDIAARALPPYPLPTPVDRGGARGARAVAARRSMRSGSRGIKAERDAAGRGFCNASPIVTRVRSGGGNFLFLEVDDAAALGASASRRSASASASGPTPRPAACALTIGTEAENARCARARSASSRRRAPARRAEIVRDTKETRIAVAVDLDRAAPRQIDTGIPFYDHMLDQVAAHGGFSLLLSCNGDLEIDAHHSIEDCAIALGTALVARRSATSAASAASASRCRWTRPRRRC